VSLVLSIFAQDILPIFLVAAVGYVLAKRVAADVRTLSTVAFNALSPCLVFDQLVTAQISRAEFGRMAAFCVLLVLAMGVVAWLAAIPLRLNRQTLSSFLLVVMFSNSGNYALPVVLFAFGREALAYASVYYVASAIVLYTVGVFVAVAAGGHGNLGRALAGIVRVPAIYAVAAAALILSTHTSVPPAVMRPIALLSDAAIPVMLLILGMQLERAAMPDRPAVVFVAVGLSLLVAPVIGVGLTMLLGMSGAARQVAILSASMPAAVITTVLALEFNLDAGFATGAVFLSTVLSPFTLVLLIAYLQR
jgi:malate permease and related proteins